MEEERNMKDEDKEGSASMEGLAELSRKIDELKNTEEGWIKAEEQLKAANQQLEASNQQLRARENELSVAYDSLNSSVNGVIITDTDGKITYANPAFLQMFEYESREQVHGKYAKDLFATGRVQKFSDVTAIIDETIGETEEFTVRRKDGMEFPVEVSSSIVTDNEDNNVGRMASFVDITERKKTQEDALRSSKEQYHGLFEGVPIGLFRTTPDGQILDANNAFIHLLGFQDKESLLALNVSDLYRDSKDRERLLKLLFMKDVVKDMEIQMHRTDNKDVWVKMNVHTIKDDEGEILFNEGSMEDITTRKQAEEAHRNNEEKYRSLTDNIPGMVYRAKPDWSVEIITTSERVSGYSVEEFSSRVVNWFDLVLTEDRNRISMEGARLLEKATSIVQEYRITAKDGTIHWVSDHKNSLFNEDGSLRGIDGVVFDITERKKAEEEIKSLARFPSENPNPVVRITKNGTIVFANLNSSPLLERWECRTGECLSPDWHQFVLDAIDTEEPSYTEIVCGEKTFAVTLAPIAESDYINVYGLDITTRKQAEEEMRAMEAQLRQSQKLESIGTLASGIAHEINNPLMGIINYAQLIHDRVQDEKLEHFSSRIIKEGNRVDKIVKNLLSFARLDKMSHSPARIEDIIEASLTLFGALLRKDQITLEQDIQKDLPKIKCRSQQIQQVITNLLTNARDALNIRYEGYHENKVVKISARSFEMKSEKWVRTIVEDHGTGIPENVIDQVFDPFFTTKSKARGLVADSKDPVGTGLGLSVSYGIITDHNGKLSVESVLGEYTRFIMDLRVNNGWVLDGSDKENESHIKEKVDD